MHQMGIDERPKPRFTLLGFLLLHMWQVVIKLVKIQFKYLSINKLKVDKNQHDWHGKVTMRILGRCHYNSV